MDIVTSIDAERIARLRDSDTFFWLDLQRPADADLERLGDLLGIHPLAREDTREFGQRPKVDTYGDHVLLVFYTARVDAPAFVPIEVHVYVSGGFVATVRRDRCVKLDALHDFLAPEGTEAEDYLVYQILDALTDAYYPVIDHIEERVDALEAEVLRRPRQVQVGAIYRLKQEVQSVQRRAVPQRDQFPAAGTAIASLPGLSHGTREYLRDVADHLAQIAGELQRQSDDLTALTGTYFNANANRLNTVVSRLTMVATFFVVSTTITGFFGQNFGWLVDNIDTRGDFLLYGVGSLALATLTLGGIFWLKRREWF